MPSPPELDERARVIAVLRSAGCVFAEDEANVLFEAAAGDGAALATLLRRRVAGEPLEHVVGWAEFCGLRVAVDPGVFVPRRRTELVARAAAARLRPGAIVVDLCCGSGAVGLAVASVVDGVWVHAVDLDPAAVHCARRNLGPVGGTVYEGDLFAPLPSALRGRVDAVVVNAPYVPSDSVALMPAEARLYENRLALDGGVDGLDIVRRVVAGVPPWLAPDGQVIVETSDEQAPALLAAADRLGLTVAVETDDDLAATVVVASAVPPSR